MARAPGALLLHPVNLIAMLVLGLNDHWLKAAWPGLVTGKLSDVAGLVVLPLVVVGSVGSVGSVGVGSAGSSCSAAYAAGMPAATRAAMAP